MLRLITQFDNARSRTSLATPTCGPCCSCCCCCIITMISASVITSRNLGKSAQSLQQQTPQAQQSSKANKVWPYVLGALLVPASLVASIALLIGLAYINLVQGLSDALIFFVAPYTLFAWLLIKKYNFSIKAAVLTFVLTACAIVAEALLWLYFISSL